MPDTQNNGLEELKQEKRDEIIRLLGNAYDRSTAQHRLDALGPNGLWLLISIIKEETEKRTHRERLLQGPRFAAVTFHAALTVGLWYLTSIGIMDGVPFFFAIGIGCIVDVVFQVAALPGLLERRATILLAEIGDKESIGILIDTLAFAPYYTSAATLAGLGRILTTLSASDSHLLSLSNVLTLNSCLKPAGQHDLVSPTIKARFQIAILKAFEQVGDVYSLDVVRAIARENPKTIARKRVVEAAIECLPYMEERISKDQSHNRLLRPSAEHIEPESELLRPAQLGSTEPAEELLRAAGIEG